MHRLIDSKLSPYFTLKIDIFNVKRKVPAESWLSAANWCSILHTADTSMVTMAIVAAGTFMIAFAGLRMAVEWAVSLQLCLFRLRSAEAYPYAHMHERAEILTNLYALSNIMTASVMAKHSLSLQSFLLSFAAESVMLSAKDLAARAVSELDYV